MQESKLKVTVSLEEIARTKGISLKTLRRWASERRFPLFRVSNRIRVSPEEFDEWFNRFHIKGREELNKHRIEPKNAGVK